MTLLEQANNETWYWHSKPIKLKDLDPKQLSSIKQTLIKSPNKMWFNKSKQKWLSSIKLVEKIKDKEVTKEAVDIIINSRINNAKLKANYITNIIIKANNKGIR